MEVSDEFGENDFKTADGDEVVARKKSIKTEDSSNQVLNVFSKSSLLDISGILNQSLLLNNVGM